MKLKAPGNVILIVSFVILSAVTILSCHPRKNSSRPDSGTSQRIASLAPSTTSILMDLGLASSLIAIDEWSARLPGVPTDIPRFDLMRPDVETLAALDPDLVFVSNMTRDGSSRDPFKPLSDAGITVVYIPTSASIADIQTDVLRIAQLTGRDEEGKGLVADMEREIGRIRDKAALIPASQRRSVFFEIEAAPNVYSFGQGVYLNELIEAVGAVNALADQTGWISVSAETILAADPAVILTNVAYIEDPVSEIKSRPGWATLRAVRQNRVYYIDNIASSQPSPSAVTALKLIAEAVYPEYFN